MNIELEWEVEMTKLAWRSHSKNIKFRANKGVIVTNDWGIMMRALLVQHDSGNHSREHSQWKGPEQTAWFNGNVKK